jgi:hypothetical protein
MELYNCFHHVARCMFIRQNLLDGFMLPYGGFNNIIKYLACKGTGGIELYHGASFHDVVLFMLKKKDFRSNLEKRLFFYYSDWDEGRMADSYNHNLPTCISIREIEKGYLRYRALEEAKTRFIDRYLLFHDDEYSPLPLRVDFPIEISICTATL